MKNKTTFETNYTIAQADFTNPFVSTISFILTDFLVNRNNQAIPETESKNIIASARTMPIKINLETGGHEDATPVGVITKTWQGSDNERNVIFAEASVWSLEFPEVDRWIKEKYQNQEPLAVSWEITYGSSEQDTENNITWLKDVIVTAVAIVNNPAYGLYRTRVLAVAESFMNEHQTNEQLLQELNDARSEVQLLREQVQQLKQELLFAQRRDVLRNLFRSDEEITARKTFVLSLSEEAFNTYVNDLNAMKQNANKEPARIELASAVAEMMPNNAIPAGLPPAPIDVIDLFKKLNF